MSELKALKEAGLLVESVTSISDRYKVIEDIGDGTYGRVQKCEDIETKEIVAIKKIKIIRQEDSFPANTIREVQLLISLKNENVVKLKKALNCRSDRTMFLVFEYCDYDMHALLYMPGVRIPSKLLIVSIMKQLMMVLHYLACQNVVHRDLKPANMFVTRDNILKLGDFGLARNLSDHSTRYSTNVITLWYRPLELLLGASSYRYEIDMWSAGCIFFEMLTNRPLFPSPNTDVDQVRTIFKICGTPNDSDWPEWRTLDKAGTFITEPKYKNVLKDHLKERIPKDFQGIIDLLLRMLQYNPKKRITPEAAVNHAFFQQFGDKVDPTKLPPLNLEEMHQLKVHETKRAQQPANAPAKRPSPAPLL